MKYLISIGLFCLSYLWIRFSQQPIDLKDVSIPAVGLFFAPQTGFWQNGVNADKFEITDFKKWDVQGKIILDERMVPHIFSDSLRDAYFMQGYIHARFRLWQMDFSTRAAEGRISEIIGNRAVEFDRLKRRKGFVHSAKESIEKWKSYPTTYALLEAYANGINAYIESLDYKDLPIEYKLMNFKPEKWTPYRSALFHKNMAEILCGRDKDVELTNARLFFGKDFNLLFPEESKLLDPVIPTPKDWGFSLDNSKNIQAENKSKSSSYIQQEKFVGESGLGSNNWALSPALTLNHNPILCNDPHLTLTLPSVWFEQQITTQDRNVYGVTFPGIPGVVIGFNKNIAWGVTNAGWDVMDWYQLEWKDTSRKQYKYGDQWLDTEIEITEIKIKNQASVYDTILRTKFGNIIYDDAKAAKSGLAMKWIINEKPSRCELETFVNLNKANTFDEYRQAITSFTYPAQNFAFASNSGDIALTVQGNMPIKKNQQGRFVQSATPENEWQGFVPDGNNPFCKNPSRGFISSANQKSTDASYPNYYNDGDFRDYRGTMINSLLRAKNNFTIDDMKAMQYNAHSLRAETALPKMLSYLDTNTLQEKTKLDIYLNLKNWKFDYDSNSIAASYFNTWFDYVQQLTWDEIHSDSLQKHTAIPSDETTIQLFNNNPDLVYFDIKNTSQRETAKQIIQIAFDSLLYYNTMHPLKPWGLQKNASIPHMARLEAFSRKQVNSSGGADIINAHTKTYGPSWRMIVELSKNGPSAFGIYPGGQSGHPGSKYYMNMIDDWSKGKYYDLHYWESIPEDKNLITINFNR